MMVEREISFPRILEVALLGVRRAAVFSTFGVNAAREATSLHFDPLACSSMQLVPTPTDPAVVNSYKEEFEKWVLVCSLREAIEAFGVYLDELHAACLVMALSANQVALDQAQKWAKGYPFKGLRDKLDLLGSRFAVDFADADMLLSVNKFRHCLSHRRGVVGDEDCGPDGTFAVIWPGINLFFVSPDGTETAMDFPILEPAAGPKGAGLSVRMSRKTATFRPGDQLQLSPTQVSEVCWFLQRAAELLCNSGEAYASRLGMRVAPDETVAETDAADS
jgi:hypothetical protein